MAMIEIERRARVVIVDDETGAADYRPEGKALRWALR